MLSPVPKIQNLQHTFIQVTTRYIAHVQAAERCGRKKQINLSQIGHKMHIILKFSNSTERYDKIIQDLGLQGNYLGLVS